MVCRSGYYLDQNAHRCEQITSENNPLQGRRCPLSHAFPLSPPNTTNSTSTSNSTEATNSSQTGNGVEEANNQTGRALCNCSQFVDAQLNFTSHKHCNCTSVEDSGYCLFEIISLNDTASNFSQQNYTGRHYNCTCNYTEREQQPTI